MIQEPLMHTEYEECHCSSHILAGDIFLWEAWDWLLGFVPSVPGKEIFWETALAVAALARGHTWSRIRFFAW